MNRRLYGSTGLAGLRSSQPLENPDNTKHLLQMLEMMDAEHLLMFASDYPHWDFDSPTHAFPKLAPALHERIFSTNARAWYGLPAAPVIGEDA